MATYSVNQVRHVIVANSYNTSGTDAGTVTGVEAFVPQTPVFGSNTGASVLYFTYINAEGQAVKSDYIDTSKIRYIKGTLNQPWQPRIDTIILTADDLVVGQDYIIRILFRGWGSGSTEDQYFKYVGAYRVQSGDTPTTVAQALTDIANRNFAREDIPLLTFSAAAGVITITEVQQPWVAGKQEGRPLDYDIQVVPIVTPTNADFIWARRGDNLVTTQAGNPGKGTARQAADMERFFHGFRGDQYRQMGYPYNWETTYLTNGQPYDMLDIMFGFVDTREGAQASEKQLVILCTSGVIADIIAAINALDVIPEVPAAA